MNRILDIHPAVYGAVPLGAPAFDAVGSGRTATKTAASDARGSGA